MKIKFSLCLLAVLAAAHVATAGYGYVKVPAPIAAASKDVPTLGVGVSKVVGVEVLGCVSNKTVILSRIDDSGASTNAISTLTTTVTDGARQYFDLSSSGWFFWAEGETWIRSGTETNAPVRLIYED